MKKGLIILMVLVTLIVISVAIFIILNKKNCIYIDKSIIFVKFAEKV